MNPLIQHDPIIWKIAECYELGNFVRYVDDFPIMDWTCKVILTTGPYKGATIRPEKEIFPYNQKLHKKLIKEFGMDDEKGLI